MRIVIGRDWPAWHNITYRAGWGVDGRVGLRTLKVDEGVGGGVRLCAVRAREGSPREVGDLRVRADLDARVVYGANTKVG